MPTTHLSIVFNHRFDANLGRLDAIYGQRFPGLTYLMPFYDGGRADVVPVHEASSSFQGFFAQAYRDLAAAHADFYAFAGDDLLLHPRLDSGNLATELKLHEPGRPDAAYVKGLNAVANQHPGWHHTLPSMRAMVPGPFVNAAGELPSHDRAVELVARHHIPLRTMTRRRAALMVWKSQRGLLRPVYLAFVLRHMERRRPYPLLVGYADFLVVPRTALKEFCRLCGVLAALRVWVEVAAPTAMAWACERIVTEADVPWRGVEYWSPAELEAGLSPRMPTGRPDLGALLASYADDELYLHPVKLSKFAKPAASATASAAAPEGIPA